jgi:hypothetical protein
MPYISAKLTEQNLMFNLFANCYFEHFAIQKVRSTNFC